MATNGNTNEGNEKRAALRDALTRIRNNLKITKVVCTRSVKGRYGDTYVGFSAAWNTIQDDAGGGADMISAQDGDTALAQANGLSLKESKIAAYALAMQADIAAHNHAMAGGNITQEQRDEAVRVIKANYTQLMLAEMDQGDTNGGKE